MQDSLDRLESTELNQLMEHYEILIAADELEMYVLPINSD